MEAPLTRIAFLLIITSIIIGAAARSPSYRHVAYPTKGAGYIVSSCHSTLFPKLCYRSLSAYATRIRASPNLLIHTALTITHKAALSADSTVRRMSRTRGLRPIEAAAMGDCREQMGDSLVELAKSVGVMGHVVRHGGFIDRPRASDIQTWVSAALTDASTCLDGLDEARIRLGVKTVVGRHVVRISRLASNVLALIHNYGPANVGIVHAP